MEFFLKDRLVHLTNLLKAIQTSDRNQKIGNGELTMANTLAL